MFAHLLAPREKAARDVARPQHRLAAGGDSPRAAAATRPAVAAAPGLPLTSSSKCSSSSSPRRAVVLPVFSALLGVRRSGPCLPQVQAAEDSVAAYTSLEGLRKLAEMHKGKHSTVHCYLDTSSGGTVVVKTYYKHTMAKRHFRNVRREVAIGRLLARQRFTGTVRLLGAFEDEGHVHLVLESCAGGDLYRRLVKAGGKLGEAQVCREVVIPLLLTLTFLHANHIVHRDIKPENILFTADGGLRLADFGLSIDAARERPTSRVGTLDYMAPEVVGMPSPDDMQRRGLTRDAIGHYCCKVDVWAVGILAYELLCGRPPFEVEDVKLTEQRIQFGEVAFPANLTPACRSFIQQALTKRPQGRPSAAQLFQHPWIRPHYQQLLAVAQAQPSSAAAALAAAAIQTPELRRTASQPPSPSKSMPGGVAGAAGEQQPLTPSGVAAALAPFLPLSQAKLAHRVRLLSPARQPSSGRTARPRRRVSDPLARTCSQPDSHLASEATSAAAVSAWPPALEAPPATPPPAAAASDGSGSVAPAADMHDDAGSGGGMGPARPHCFETPGTPGLKTTPLPRQRPVQQQQQQRAPLGRTPFLVPLVPPGGGSGHAAGAGPGPAKGLQPGPPSMRGSKAGARRSRFAAAAENDESRAAAAAASAALQAGAGAEVPLSSPLLAGRASSFTSLLSKQSSSGSNLQLTDRAVSFGGNCSNGGSQPLVPRASSFTAFGGTLSNLGSPSGAKQPQHAPSDAGMVAAGQFQRLQL